MIGYLLRHAQVLLGTLGQLARAPLSALPTIAVIGITLALPSLLYVLLDNAQRVAAGWEGGARLSVFLEGTTTEREARRLADELEALPEIARVEYISKEQALAEFKRLSGFGAALEALERNPLPAVLVVQPAHSEPEALRRLAQAIEKRPQVDFAQLDLQWVRRLRAMLRLAERGVWLLAALLAVAVLLIVGNTIRLAILNRRHEIEIIKLIGGTDAFIRRPFLYTGLLHGLFGALLAWALVALSLKILEGPVGELAGLYGSRYRMQGLDLQAGLALLGTGAALGWLASRLAVGRHLAAIEPR